jgi:transcriptional regulator with XRE-family HTH domain
LINNLPLYKYYSNIQLIVNINNTDSILNIIPITAKLLSGGMYMDHVALGKRIREERLKLRLTQEKLAEDVDVSSSYIGQVERGEKSVTLDTLVRITRRLSVTVDYLLKDSIDIDNDTYIDQIKQLLHGRNAKQKQMALDVLKVMFSNMDNE